MASLVVGGELTVQHHLADYLNRIAVCCRTNVAL